MGMENHLQFGQVNAVSVIFLVKLKQNILELGEAGDKHADCKTMAKQISKGQSLQYKNGLKP